jgi:predicted nucleic acid-binding protein
VLVYFDSSAFVKLLVEEEASDVVSDLWRGCDAPVSSRLAHVDVRAALAAAGRDHRLNTSAVRTAVQDWGRFWSVTRPVELTKAVEQHAGELAGAHALRGADAVHLASALAVDSGDLVFASWDRRLAAGADAVGLAVVPVE